jgi:NAD(P)-dependent dehydrogenase (short-subunit alcohol dehydrogenase family)
VDAALADRGRIDILVNNVGSVTPRTTGFLLVTDDEWARSITLNFLAAVRTTRAALPAMLTAGRGSIVNTASVNATLPGPAVIDYGAAKAALVNLTKTLSKELGPHGIRVNSIGPSPVATDLWLGVGGVAQPSPPPPAPPRVRSPTRRPPRRSPVVSPDRRKSPTSRCSWPAITSPATSPART